MQKKSVALYIFLPIIIAIIFMVSTVWFHWPLWQRPFRSDFSPISWLSSTQIFAVAFVIVCLLIDDALNWKLGGWLFISTLSMALDEQFQFHELWKYSCDSWVQLCRFTLIRELPIILVGILGFLTMCILHKTFYKPLERTLLWIAVAIGILSVTVDQITYFGLISDFEEGFEVLSEAFFLAGLLAIKASRKNTSQ